MALGDFEFCFSFPLAKKTLTFDQIKRFKENQLLFWGDEGTEIYQAPEFHQVNPTLSFPIDVWGAGLVFASLVIFFCLDSSFDHQ